MIRTSWAAVSRSSAPGDAARVSRPDKANSGGTDLTAPTELPRTAHAANSKHVTSITRPKGIASKSKQVTVFCVLQLRSIRPEESS